MPIGLHYDDHFLIWAARGYPGFQELARPWFDMFNFADGGTRASADGSFIGGSTGCGTDVSGYLLDQSVYTVFPVDGPMGLRVRTNLPSGSLMGMLADYLRVADSGPAGYLNAPGFVSGTQYTLEFSAARTATTSMQVSARISGGGLVFFNSATDANYPCHRFDCFAIRCDNATNATSACFAGVVCKSARTMHSTRMR